MRKKKTSKQRGVLAASVLLAGVIAAGGTFAWVTSQDEVVNQLSASNNYGVSITEDFTPPEEWVPGQEITKKVSAVNTGNIDAFVKMTVSNTMELTTLKNISTAPGQIPSGQTENTYDYVKLSADEVKSIQAGGILAGFWEFYNADFGFSYNERPEDSAVGTDYKPQTTGLYLFLKYIEPGEWTDYYWEGYYYDADSDSYYAVQNGIHSVGPTYDWTVSGYDENGLYKLSDGEKPPASYPIIYYIVKETKTVTPSLVYDGDNQQITATYNAEYKVNNIVINIKLDEAYADNWTYEEGSSEPVFYYNSILKAGKTANNLITAVELDGNVSADAYYQFDYNLSVKLDSVQASPDGAKTTAVNAQTGWMTAAVGEDGTTVTWTKKSGN